MPSISRRKIHNGNLNRIKRRKPAIAIVGSGIVGTASGTVFYDKGFDVTFVDDQIAVVNRLKTEGYKSVTSDSLVPDQIDVFFVSVPTYTADEEGGTKNIRTAAENLGKWIQKKDTYCLVVIRSTVLPGTTEKLIIPTLEKISGKKAGRDFGVCVNPEYLREKSAVSDFKKPWVVVIGAINKKAGDIVERLYSWVKCPVYRVTIREAEMQKFVHNLYNANKISFFNEMRLACRQLDMNCEKVFFLATLSAEAMWNPLYGTKDFGPFSGSCLPKDTKAFNKFADNDLKIKMRILQTVLDFNNDLLKNIK